MNYVGIDLHKETSWFYIVDEHGKKIATKNVANNLCELKDYFSTIPEPFTVAVEATYNWYFIVDLAETYAYKVFLANSYELKAFAKRHKKTDKIDAKLIATILQKGFLPTVSIADSYTRQVRELLRYRIRVVADRSRNIYRLKNLMDKLGMISTGNFTSWKQLQAIPTETLPDIYSGLVEKIKEHIIFLNQKIYQLDKEIMVLSKNNQDIENLLTIPGIGSFTAALITTEIIDIKRFQSFNRLCAYCGLAPRVSASAKIIHRGPLNKNRSKYLQWILLETVLHFIKADESRLQKFEKIKNRKGFNTAKVALARDYLKVIYHVLKEKRQYYCQNTIQSEAMNALLGV